MWLFVCMFSLVFVAFSPSISHTLRSSVSPSPSLLFGLQETIKKKEDYSNRAYASSLVQKGKEDPSLKNASFPVRIGTTSPSLSLSLSIYIYIYVCVCTYVFVALSHTHTLSHTYTAESRLGSHRSASRLCL